MSSTPSPISTTKNVIIFAVFSDGSVIAQQENLPQLSLGVPGGGAVVPMGETWSWTVIDQSGFSGSPRFWLTIPDPDNSAFADLHWSGIDNQDWEFGREGTLVVDVTPSSPTARKWRLTVKVAIRSINFKDVTFFTPGSMLTLRPCKKPPLISRAFYTFTLTLPGSTGSSSGVDFRHARFSSMGSSTSTPSTGSTSDGDYRLDLARTFDSGPKIDLQLNPGDQFSEPRDTWIGLEIDGLGIGSSRTSRFRMLASVRPLTVSGTEGVFPDSDVQTLVKGTPLELSIAGEPISPTGFRWGVKEFDNYAFKLDPSFKPLGSGSTASLELEDVSQWDWYAGTKSSRETGLEGAVVLEVSDGRRPPAEVKFDIQLQRDTEPVSLLAGTLLTGPDGQEYEIVEDGKYHPVVSGYVRDREIRLENIRDGLEDYEYLHLLAELTDAVRKLPPTTPRQKYLDRAAKLLEVPPLIVHDLTDYTRNPRELYAFRANVAQAILEGRPLAGREPGSPDG